MVGAEGVTANVEKHVGCQVACGILGLECFACKQELNICESVWEAGKQQRSTWSYIQILGFPPQAVGLLPSRKHTRASTHTKTAPCHS